MSQRDLYVSLLLAHVGDRYNAARPCSCHGTCPGWDCSGFASGDLLSEARGSSFPCGNTDTLAAYLIAHHLTCSRATSRATRGAWAIREKRNPLFPGDGHIVISLGDGRTVEAHDTRDGVYIGTFDGNRGFQVYGYPPGISGFAVAPSPVPPLPQPLPPPEDDMLNAADIEAIRQIVKQEVEACIGGASLSPPDAHATVVDVVKHYSSGG